MSSVSPLSKAAFPSLPSPSPPPPLKLPHPLSVSDAEVLHLIRQRRGRTRGEGKQAGPLQTQHVERENQATASESGGSGKCWKKQRPEFASRFAALPVGFSSAGSARRFQLWNCRHRRQPRSRVLLKLHCSIFLCWRGGRA